MIRGCFPLRNVDGRRSTEPTRRDAGQGHHSQVGHWISEGKKGNTDIGARIDERARVGSGVYDSVSMLDLLMNE